MKVCAGIVLFHPDIDRLKQNVDAVLPQVDRLYLFNNASDEYPQLREAFTDTKYTINDNITWINSDDNIGIAAALNRLMQAACSDGFRLMLTLDQDSICADDLVEKLLEAAQTYDNVAITSPRIIEQGRVWEDAYSKVGKKKHTNKTNNVETAGLVEDVTYCITSGSLTNIDAVINAGGFNERLFIDDVDRDMCIRLCYRGHRILRVNSAELHHEFGDKLVERKFLFLKYKYRNYSPFRVYYQIRNTVYMVRKYGGDYKPYPIWRLIRPFLTFFVKFIFEPQRIKRLSAFVRGYAAGLTMKL